MAFHILNARCNCPQELDLDSVVDFGAVYIGRETGIGNLDLPITTADGGQITQDDGAHVLIHSYGTDNYFAGWDSGNFTLTGSKNTGVGPLALNSLTDGLGNTGLGYNSLGANEDGQQNVALGWASGKDSVSANYVTFAGALSGFRSTGDYNTFYGAYSGQGIESGSKNVFVGYNTGGYDAGGGIVVDPTSELNVAIGHSTLLANGTYTVAIGAYAMDTANGDVSQAVAIGGVAMRYTEGAPRSIGIGYEAGAYMSTPDNVALGYRALYGAGTGLTGVGNDNNIAIGRESLSLLTTGGSNIAAGKSSLGNLGTGSNNVAWGENAGLGLYDGSTLNTIIGHNACSKAVPTTPSTQNTVIGNAAGSALDGATNSMLLGHQAGLSLVDGIGNTLLGATAATLLSASDYSTIVGFASGGGLTTEDESTAVGAYAMRAITGSANVALGFKALGKSSNAAASTGNTAVGHQALLALDGGHYNVAIGPDTGYALSDGDYNVLISRGAGVNLTDQDAVIGIGGYSATNVDPGTVAVGYNAARNIYADGASPSIAIGYGALSPLSATAETPWNVAIGYEAMGTANGSARNVVVGNNAANVVQQWLMDSIVIGDKAVNGGIGLDQSVVIGADSAQSSNITGGNVYIGHQVAKPLWGNNSVLLGAGAAANSAGTTVTAGSVGAGFQTLYSLNGGDYNTALGFKSLYSVVSTGENVGVGREALYTNTGSRNVAVGAYANYYGGATNGNVSVGYCALFNLPGGEGNTAVGYDAGRGLAQTSSANVAVGQSALGKDSPTGDTNNNVAVGVNALSTCDGGNDNTAVGTGCLIDLTTGSDNVGVGQCLGSLTDGQFNVAAGNGALSSVEGGTYNTAVGYGAGGGVVGNGYNTAVGAQALRTVYGQWNTAVGYQALGKSSQTADSTANTAVGYQALVGMNGGNDNVAVGMNAGNKISTGNYNVLVGRFAGDDLVVQNGVIGVGYASATVASRYSVHVGTYAGYDCAGTQDEPNISIGYYAMGGVTGTNNWNVAIGAQALSNIAGASQNVVVGNNSAVNLTTAPYTVVVGDSSGGGITDGATANNVIVGALAAQGAKAHQCVAIGYRSMRSQSPTGSALYNVAVGGDTMMTIDGAQYNTGVGNGALSSLIGGDYNTACGAGALAQVTANGYNTAVGYQCGANMDVLAETANALHGYRAGYGLHGADNVAVGFEALAGSTENVSGPTDGNTAIGRRSLYALDGGDYNTACGYGSGSGLTSGAGNVLLGRGAGDDLTTESNQLRIENSTGTALIGGEFSATTPKAWVNGSLDVYKANGTDSMYWHEYVMPAFTTDPGVTGATFVAPSVNGPGGYQLDAAGEELYTQAHVEADWDGVTDMVVHVYFQLNAAGSLGTDTVDLRLQCFYMGDGETSAKTQTVEVAKTVGTAAQYTQFETTFTIDYDLASNVVEAGDVFGFTLNLETDSSEVTDIIVNYAEFKYRTPKPAAEAP